MLESLELRMVFVTLCFTLQNLLSEQGLAPKGHDPFGI
jgi:hypothetical protein